MGRRGGGDPRSSGGLREPAAGVVRNPGSGEGNLALRALSRESRGAFPRTREWGRAGRGWILPPRACLAAPVGRFRRGRLEAVSEKRPGRAGRIIAGFARIVWAGGTRNPAQLDRPAGRFPCREGRAHRCRSCRRCRRTVERGSDGHLHLLHHRGGRILEGRGGKPRPGSGHRGEDPGGDASSPGEPPAGIRDRRRGDRLSRRRPEPLDRRGGKPAGFPRVRVLDFGPPGDSGWIQSTGLRPHAGEPIHHRGGRLPFADDRS